MIFAEAGLMTMDVPRLSKFYREVLKTESDCDDTVHQEIRTNGAALTMYFEDPAGNTVVFRSFP